MTDSQNFGEIMPTAFENKLAKRKRILESAYSLFITKSVSSTAIDDVVKMAGVAKGTFYLYFKDKYDLLDQIIYEKSASVIISGLDIIKNRSDFPSLGFEEKILLFVDYMTGYLSDNKELSVLLNKNLSRCFRYITTDEKSENSELLERVMKIFTENGYSREKALSSIYLIAEMIGSICCDLILGSAPFKFEQMYPDIKMLISTVLEAGKNG